MYSSIAGGTAQTYLWPPTSFNCFQGLDNNNLEQGFGTSCSRILTLDPKPLRIVLPMIPTPTHKMFMHRKLTTQGAAVLSWKV